MFTMYPDPREEADPVALLAKFDWSQLPDPVPGFKHILHINQNADGSLNEDNPYLFIKNVPIKK